MNSRLILNHCLVSLVLSALLMGATAAAQDRYDADEPEYQRAPTPTGDWRYEGPRVSRPQRADYAEQIDEARPARHRTMDRSAASYRQPPRPAYRQSARPAYRDQRYVPEPRVDERYFEEQPRTRRYDDRVVRAARPRHDDHVEQLGYEWHPGREQAQRAKLAEAPAYRPEVARKPSSNLLPERDLMREPTIVSRPPRVAARPQYRPASAGTTYELPPAAEAIEPQPEMMPQREGNIVYDEGGYEGGPMEYGSDDFGPDGYGPYGDCGNGMYMTPCPDCGACCGGISCPHHWLDESSVFVGVHAFKGGLDQGQNGNFGFQEGVNFAGSLWHAYGIGYQVGGQFLQSDLSGSNIASAFNNSRQQAFLTVGLFHRPACGQGFQGGAVYDWLDDRFYDRTRFAQVRGELSYIGFDGHELGFWGAFSSGANQTVLISQQPVTFGSTNLYNFFYRKNMANGDQGRIWGGFTGNSGGMVGADYRVHMSNAWDMVGGFNYLIPGDKNGIASGAQESWGLSMNVVWYPTRDKCGVHNGPFRSLFGVADNNVFMVQQK